MRAIAAITATFLLLTTLCLTVPETASAFPLTHTVRRGENLYRIALRYGVSVEAIVRANGLSDPERILAGQVLTIPKTRRVTAKALPAARTHVVKAGETLHSVARRYGTSVASLMRANGLRSDRLQPGQRLVVSHPAPDIGSQLVTPQPLHVRRGPQSFFTTLALVAGDTPLQILGEYNGWFQVQLPDGDVGWVRKDDLRAGPAQGSIDYPASIRGGDIARDAVRYLGTPYRWGGETNRGVDCSGFVYIVFSNRVPGLARLRSYDYFQMGTAVHATNLLPGDLVFFSTYAAGPSHVGIYLGDRKFIHAASGARRVMLNSLDDSYYVTRYLGARRLLNP